MDKQNRVNNMKVRLTCPDGAIDIGFSAAAPGATSISAPNWNRYTTSLLVGGKKSCLIQY